MSKKKLKAYSNEIERDMRLHFEQLSEKNQRHYAAIEALKLGHGGITYIAELFEITRNRVRTGIQELRNEDLLNEIPPNKQRRSGGGRKKNSQKVNTVNSYMI